MFNISIFFNPDNKEKLQENKARLRKIAAGEYTELPEISTFRCSSIEDIYRRNNLGNFFRRIFNSDEYLRLDNLFSGLGNYDHEFCGLLRELGHMIQVDATGTLNFVKTGDYEAANRKIGC